MRAERIGVLYQQANLVGHLSIEDNVALAQRLSTDIDGQANRDDLLGRCGIAQRAGARPAQLSGGELARAGLAVALANDPVVLLADEPTGELDSLTAAKVTELLRERAAGGTAILIATHSTELAAAADRGVALRDGKVEA
jgi:putative ABC transport system ATP-binding protein